MSIVNGRGKCRIIAGKWRGRVLKFDDAEGLRPTTDRIRETVFNWLQTYIPKSHCLDCFAGSGVLGFESMSRGAEKLTLIENNIRTHENLKKNASELGVVKSDVVILREDTLFWLEKKASMAVDAPFDLVFLDPPFHSDLLKKSCILLNDSGCLAEDAVIYVEHAIDDVVDIPESWVCLKEKSSGQVTYKLFSNS